MLVGYVRLSLQEPTPDRQLETLRQAGCERVFIDERNGARREQPGFHKACALMQVVEHVEELQRRRFGLRSLLEQIDTTGPDGPAQLRAITALVACERSLVSERTQTGLGFARARGRLGGRKPKMTPAMIQQAAQLMQNPAVSVNEICKMLKVGRTTLYRYISPTGEVRQE